MPFKSMVASIGTGLVNNALSQGNAQEQRDWQEKMWKMQNAYNSPSAMADRMRAAGLNPYMMQGAEPAGSVGTGATAQTIPLDNPLAYAKTFAEIDNLNASTNKTEHESEKLLKDMSMLDLMYSRGLLEKEEYEFNMRKYFEQWQDKNPYTVEAKYKEAGTALLDEQKNTEKKKQLNLDALTETENTLRDVTKENFEQQIKESQERVKVLDAESKKLIRETEQIENLIERQDIVNAANAFYGITIDVLPPTLQHRLMDNWQKAVKGEIYEETALRVAASAVEEYRDKELHIPRTKSWTESKSVSSGSGPFKASGSESYGWTEVY